MLNIKPVGPPNQTPVPVRYAFLAPSRMKIRRPDGLVVEMGYGIGDIIEIMEIPVQFCIRGHEIWDEIPLSDGGAVVEYDETAKLQAVFRPY